jgi:hypothetical protein
MPDTGAVTPDRSPDARPKRRRVTAPATGAITSADAASSRPSADDADEPPVLPRTSSDEQDVGWGEVPDGRDGGERDEEWYRRERPPHHGG